MRFEDAQAVVGSTPHMTAKQARTVYDFVLERKPERILELGFAHGASTVYFAAAVDELGSGSVTTVDRAAALDREPNIHRLLAEAGLDHLVDVVISETSYTWDLAHMLQANPQPSFDFAYIDGAHLWDVDALAFTLVDRLLAPGGTVLFDDLNWTLERSPSLRNAHWVRALPEEQRATPQVRMVFELLVRTHPDYGDFRDEDGWGWATKR